jgi:(p)ppGpp synthase/HD superfamily hydrolase
VAWEETQDRLFSSEIQVDVSNRMGVLAAVASSIAGTQTNIDHVLVEEGDVDSSMIRMELQVQNRRQLARVIRTIRRMPDVHKVWRTLA